MLSDSELKELKQTVDRVVDELDIMTDLVSGDDARNITGLVKDMVMVREFITKWDKREYLIRGVFLLLSSNLLLTILGIAVAFLGG